MINNFWTSKPTDLYTQLHTSENGLDDAAASKLLKQQQAGRKQANKTLDAIKLFLGQFKSPLVILLIVAVVLSAVLGQIDDAIIITVILLTTGVLGFWQEFKAGKVVEKLKAMLAVKNHVLRGGKNIEVNAEDVVAGDVVLLSAGDLVPADGLLIEANEVHANEASLTGESYPVRKSTEPVDVNVPVAKRFNSLWKGSSIVSGTAKMLAVNVGDETMFGQIASSVGRATETAFEHGVTKFGLFLLKITLVLAVFTLCVNLFFHRPLIESILFALALAVGMAPELLPVINTLAMSAGARRMLEKKVIVKKLSSIQNLGEVNLLCTDKTGTITTGVIEVTGAKDAQGNDSDYVQTLARLNAEFESGYANPLDDALRKLPLPKEQYAKIGEVPYDFMRKRLSVAVKQNDRRMLVTKGALQNILDVSSQVLVANNQTEAIQNQLPQINKNFETYSSQGFRVMGVSYKNLNADTISKDDEKDMVFAGFILLQDPIKEGLLDSIKALRDLQVDLKIITGDNANIAQYIGQQLGIQNPKIISGANLDAITAEALAQQAADTHIFAEVAPQQKERIIAALRKNFTVAYMGDGINDVAALNGADVGISVNNAVDVAKEAADFVLMEQDLSVITDGIREGRRTFANTLKYIFINTGAAFGNMFSVAVASLMLPFLPMLPKQILLTNFLTDFPYVAVASDNVDAETISRPGRWDLKMIRNFMIVFGIHSSVFDILTFYVLYRWFHGGESVFQTGWLVESVLTELSILFIVRSQRPFFKSVPGKALIYLSAVSAVVTMLLPWIPINRYLGLTPLTLYVTLAMIGIVLLYAITADWMKLWFFRRGTRHAVAR